MFEKAIGILRLKLIHLIKMKSSIRGAKLKLMNDKIRMISMHKKLMSKMNIKTIWFCTYISVLLLPFIIFSFNYFQIYELIETDVNTNNLILLRQVQKTIDTSINDLNKTITNLHLDSKVNFFAFFRNRIKPNQYYILYQLIEDIRAFKIKLLRIFMTSV